MCGINGIINLKNNDVSIEDIRLMMKRMKHRGPDDEGIYLKENIGLGFVRLSIQDLSIAGHQPMFSDDHRYIIVFNGEIYNYIELREELSEKYSFKTGTDTEVILAAYQEWGENCLNKFNGMFSFVIYDTVSSDIFGARDRFGIKPFYYFLDKNKFIFGSEIKSILPLIGELKPNDESIYDYLLFNKTDHSDATFFNGVKKLKHGYIFTIKNSIVSFKNWYDLKHNIKNASSLTPDAYRKLFKDSLKLRLRADVPVGVTLSGGIDSSSIVSSLVKDFKLININTFSAVFGKNEPSDESEFIDEFKSMVRNMHSVSPNSETFLNDLENFIEAHNEPMPDTSPYAQYKVMELASKNVKVTLDGQGADEALAGYHYFFGSYFIELLRKYKLATFLKENFQYLKKHRSLLGLKYFFFYLMPTNLQTKLSQQVYPSVNKDFVNRFKGNSTINEKLYKPKDLNDSLLQHFEYKLEHLLKWEDLNSMNFSIESRVPFLDHRLVEATLSSDSNVKIFKGETKHILRFALKDILPIKIFNRKDKKGFSNPRDKWFRTKEFRNLVYNIINSDRFKQRGYFDHKVVSIQYDRHLNGEIDISKEIWKWINLELWFRKFIDTDNNDTINPLIKD